jgi:group I intron endonuclease
MITYKATNTKNGKWYVGSTLNFEKRKKQHLNSKQKTPFHNALRKSPEIFLWEILEENDLNTRDTEQFILDEYFGSEQCYNLSSSAGGFNSEMAKKASLSRTDDGKRQGGLKSGPKVGKLTHEKHPEKMKENGKKTLTLLIERNPNHQSDAGKIGGRLGSREKKRVGGLKCKELKIGMFSLSTERRSEISRNNITKLNSQLWEDPDHPELGAHTAGTLVSMQKRRGFPSGKENRVRVIVE